MPSGVKPPGKARISTSGRDFARLRSVFEHLEEVRAGHVLLFAAVLVDPIRHGAVLNRDVGDEVVDVHVARGEVDADLHQLVLWRLEERGTAEGRDICIAGAVDDALSLDHLTPRLALGDHARDSALVHDGAHGERVEKRRDSRFEHHRIRNRLEHLGAKDLVRRLAVDDEPVRLGSCDEHLVDGRVGDDLEQVDASAHLLGLGFDLSTNAAGVHGLRKTVPGDGSHDRLRDDAAKETVSLDEHRLRTCLCCTDRGSET